MKYFILLFASLFVFSYCSNNRKQVQSEQEASKEEQPKPEFTRDMVKMEKQLLYDQHTLRDTFPYKDTVRIFQWGKIHDRLFLIDSMQQRPNTWAILQNYKNRNGRAPEVRNSKKNEYKNLADAYGNEQNQSVPLYLLTDTITAERYGKDGALVKYMGINNDSTFVKVNPVYITGEWMVPAKYVKRINDSVVFKKAIFVDRTNQNIATLEKVGPVWYVRSMNPATTGAHRPPYQHPTPLGIFVVQERKPKMVYYKDGTTEIGGFAPYASRFCNGGYLHGVPVNEPGTKMIEFSSTLGTTPRSHMCVRNATSHAKFMYEWAPLEQTLVFVFD